MKVFVILLVLIGVTGTFLAVDPSYGLWMPSSPEELVQQSKTIFVGTVVKINLIDVDYFSQIARNGTLKESISPETMQLEEYTVHVEEFLKNPQETDTITVLRATVGGVPGGPAKISGFDVGERVLFYLPNDEKQTHFQGQYLPESFRIPEQCDAKMTLKSKRIEGKNYFSRMQNGIEINNNFIANIPIQFRYDRDVGTLSGQSFEVNVGISKITDDARINVFQKTIQVNVEPCEWVGSAKWNFVPQNGEYSMNIQVFEDTGRTSSNIRFSVLDSLNEIMLPLKQSQSGIPFNEIQCRQNLLLIQKYDGSPACVTESTKLKLIERGWTGITMVLNDNQRGIGSYLKQVEILDENYVRMSMSYPTNDAKHEIYPDDNQSIVSGCTEQNNTATLSLLYLQKIDTIQNQITFRHENKTFDGLQCDEALWQELTKWGYCGPPSTILDQDTVVSLEEANKQTVFPLIIPSFLPDGYSVQTITLRNNDRATLYISPNPVSNETGICEFIWADGGIFLSFIKHPEILNWGSSSNFNEIPPKQRFSINDNPAITQNRWVGDRFGMPIPMRSELQLSMPENDVLISMSSSLSSDELIKIAESLEARK